MELLALLDQSTAFFNAVDWGRAKGSPFACPFRGMFGPNNSHLILPRAQRNNRPTINGIMVVYFR